MHTIIKGQTYEQERALYHAKDVEVIDCLFLGENDGESPLKEARNIIVTNSDFHLRYPLWHVEQFTLNKSSFYDTARAPIWYAKEGIVNDSNIKVLKCFRHCEHIDVIHSTIASEEAFWMSKNISLNDSTVTGDYQFLRAENITINHSTLSGKYGLQYMNNVTIKNSKLEMKDAFWHSENVTITDSEIDGAYLGWYSKNLTLINCTITGTQPFCYCDDLTLINCTMKDCDLAFEYSSVNADIKGTILSVKNPKSGRIKADKIEEIILCDSIMDSSTVIEG